MFRTALRLGILPLLAFFVVWMSATGPLQFLYWLLIPLSPFVMAALLLSYWRFNADKPTGAVPFWARRSAPLIWGVCLMLTFSVVLTEWPLHLSFRASQVQLEALVADSRAKKPVKLPQQIGNFNVTDIDSDWNSTILYLDGADGGDGAKLMWLSPALRAEIGSDAQYLSESWIFRSDL